MSYEFFRIIKNKIKNTTYDIAKKWNINSIRLLLLKAGAIIMKTKRQIKISITNAFVHKDLYIMLLC
jgi:hypothetical protein